MLLMGSVSLTLHAMTRAAERHPGLTGEQMQAEVADAIQHGRQACRLPAWVSHPVKGRYRRRHKGRYRYVWDETLTRCYVVSRQSAGETVLTVLPHP